MNELQQCEFSILKSFIDICERLKLNYYLVCGSALGAVKYQGFIPWDDDVDVALLREDYEIFVEKAPQLFPEHLFLQNHYSEPACPFIYSKLRDSNTAFIEKSSADLPIHQGVYIDIFPLDGYPDSNFAALLFESKKFIYHRLLVAVYQQPTRLKALLALPFRLLGVRRWYPHVTERYCQLVKKYKTAASSLYCNHGNWQGRLEYAPKEQYQNGTDAYFEGLKVRIPENYDEYLTQKYGDWRADLPADEQRGHHFYLVCDLEKSYVNYVK